jgi:hypothetical protein
MAERKTKAVDEAAVTTTMPVLRPAVMVPRRDSSALVPVIVLGGAMSMTLLGAIAWFQMQQRPTPDVAPVRTRTVVVPAPAATPPATPPARCPSYGQRGEGSDEQVAPNDCGDPSARERAMRDAIDQIDRGVEPNQP